MKKTFLFYFLALVLGLGFTSCKPDDNSEEKQYICNLKVQSHRIESEDSTFIMSYRNEKKMILSTCAKVFKADSNFVFTITATSLDELKNKVQELFQQVSAEFSDTEWKGNHTALAYWQEEERKSTRIGDVNFGNGIDQAFYRDYEDLCYDHAGIGWSTYSFDQTQTIRYIERIAIGTSNDFDKTYDLSLDDLDLNNWAGGKYVYLLAHERKWATDAIITDLIILKSDYALGDKYTIQYNGRTYHMSNRRNSSTGDLNQGAGGPYLYLMYTKDYYDGYLLVNIRGHHDYSPFKIPVSEQAPEDARAVNRAVPMINTDGHLIKGQEVADCNYGIKDHKADGNDNGDFIYLQAKYFKRGY